VVVTKITLDAREMEHPIPLQLALGHLQKMAQEEYLYMIHRKKPIPLIELAKEKEFLYLVKQDTQEVWHILIAKNQNIKLEELVDV
jgi:uncharacterized protein (DUF2249 family)